MKNQKKSVKVLIFLLFALFVLTKFSFSLIQNIVIDYIFLLQAAPPVSAIVVDQPIAYKTGNRVVSTRYRVKYEFEVDGKKFKGAGAFTLPPESKTITIYYNRNDPTRSRLYPLETTGKWIGLLILLGCLYPVCATLWGYKIFYLS